MPSPEAATTSSPAAENLHHSGPADPKNICISRKQAPNTLLSTINTTTSINTVVVITTTATINSSTEGAARFTPVATTGDASSSFAGTALHSQPPAPPAPANSTPSPPFTQGKVSPTNTRAGQQAHNVVRNAGREAHVGTNNSNHDSLPATRARRRSTKEEDKKVARPTFPDRGRETGHYYDVSGLGEARDSNNDTGPGLGASWYVAPQTTPLSGDNSGKSTSSARAAGGAMSSKRRSVKFCLELKVYLIPRAKEYNERCACVERERERAPCVCVCDVSSCACCFGSFRRRSSVPLNRATVLLLL